MRFVFIPCSDLVFYLMGSGEYDELACAEILRATIQVLKDVLGKTPSAALLFDKYTKLCVVMDEIINEVRHHNILGGMVVGCKGRG